MGRRGSESAWKGTYWSSLFKPVSVGFWLRVAETVLGDIDDKLRFFFFLCRNIGIEKLVVS